LDSGTRFSEQANVRIEEFDLEKGRVLIHGKGDYDRIVVFSAGTKKALWKYLAFARSVSRMRRNSGYG